MFQLALIKKFILNSHWCWKGDEADVVELIQKIPEHLPCIASIEHSWSGQVLVSGFVGCSTIDSGTVSLFALTSDLTNSETVAATL